MLNGHWRSNTIWRRSSATWKRRLNADNTFPLDAKTYRILRQDICVGLRGAYVRVEQRLDGSVAARFNGRYLRIERCEQH